MLYEWLPLWVLLTSAIAAGGIFALGETHQAGRVTLNLIAALIKVVLVGIMLVGIYLGHSFEFRWTVAPGLDLLLRADALSLLFITLSAILWLVTTVYAIGYLESSPHRARFFGFFSLCVTATMGIATAGNLFTFVLFYELLTLATYPLVIHRGTRRAFQGGAAYLRYTLLGGALLLLGAIGLHAAAGPQEFTPGGYLRDRGLSDPLLIGLFVLLIAGVGVKAALVPLHGWLPIAMVAPAPVSALLHAVAVVKAGAFGVVRIVHDVYGHTLAAELGVGLALAGLAAITILYGSLRALTQTDLKRRLAYSTVSQVSYIVLGTALGGPLALVGGLVHLVHQGLMKITLFFCAGNLAETLGVHKIHQLDGTGRRMPWTMAAFTVGAFGMMGTPPVAGFVSKWYLGAGSLVQEHPWVVAVLVASTLLNAAYFLPLLQRAWFRPPPAQWTDEHPHPRFEASPLLVGSVVFTAVAALGVGLLAAAPFSPLHWVSLIVERHYG